MGKKVVNAFLHEKNKSSFSSIFSLKEQKRILKKEPKLKELSQEELEEKIIVLSSLQFEDFKQVLLKYPELLLLDTYFVSERMLKLVQKYQDIGLAQEAFLDEIIQKKE